MTTIIKTLKASPYYIEDVMGKDLEDRANNGELSFLLLNQPPHCNYKCKRCFRGEYDERTYNPKKALSLDESKRILKEAKEHGILSLEISGHGEPTLSKNLDPIIKYASDLGLMITLITNGDKLNEDRIKFYRNNNVTLVLSMQTLNKMLYEEDSGIKGSFKRKLENIELASEIYCGTKTIENGYEVYRLTLHTCLEKNNLDEVERLKEFAHERGMFYSIAPLALIGSALKHSEIHPENGEKKLEDIVPRGDNSIIHSHSSKKVFGREVCGTAFYGLNIGWDGSILLDAHYGYEIGEKNLLGNIRNIPFREAVKNQRKYIKKLFNYIGSSCPIRDPKGKEFLRKVLNKEIEL
jgi:MoaA/NifB/PqqE/SkfB family radical SAM enzyme